MLSALCTPRTSFWKRKLGSRWNRSLLEKEAGERLLQGAGRAVCIAVFCEVMNAGRMNSLRSQRLISPDNQGTDSGHTKVKLFMFTFMNFDFYPWIRNCDFKY